MALKYWTSSLDSHKNNFFYLAQITWFKSKAGMNLKIKKIIIS